MQVETFTLPPIVVTAPAFSFTNSNLLHNYFSLTNNFFPGSFTNFTNFAFATPSPNFSLGSPTVNWVDSDGSKTWIYVMAGGGGGIGPLAGEGGEYYLIDPYTGEYHRWIYGSLGVGLGFGGAAQVEVGIFEGPTDPTKISPWSLTVSGFAAAGKGMSGQYTGTSFWGQGESGATGGVAGGAGAGVAGMVTYSWYQGSGTLW